MRRKFLYVLLNIVTAFMIMGMGGGTAASAFSIVLDILGIILIVSGISIFGQTFFGDRDADYYEDMPMSSQIIAALILIVPGALCMSFSDSINANSGIAQIVTGVLLILYGVYRMRKCIKEHDVYYVEGFAKACSFIYPILMICGGACLFVSWLHVLFSICTIVAGLLLIVRTILVAKEN